MLSKDKFKKKFLIYSWLNMNTDSWIGENQLFEKKNGLAQICNRNKELP